VHTFTGVFRDVFTAQHAPSANARAVDPRVDEWAFAQSVLSDGGFSSHVVRADQMSFLHGMETLVHAYGQPFHPRSHYLATGIAESVREAGIRVLMDGSEGDVVVGYGLDYFDGLAAEGDWATFAQVAEAYAGNCRSGGRRYLPESAFWAHGLDALRDHLLNGRWGRFLRELAAVRRTLGISAPRLVHRALRSALAARSSAEAGRNGAPEHTANPVYRRAMALVRNPMLAETLDAADALYAAHGLEARHPFFDRRVVEYCLSLPAEQRMKGGWTRSILRRALRDVLPNEIQTRVGKSDLGRAVVRHVCPRDLETITRLAAAGSLRPYASSREVQRAVHRFTEAPSVSHLKPLVHLAVLSTWLNGTTEDFTGLCASSHASLHGKC
jgi:asparagine synthase (glutamine-hydrolysing)